MVLAPWFLRLGNEDVLALADIALAGVVDETCSLALLPVAA